MRTSHLRWVSAVLAVLVAGCSADQPLSSSEHAAVSEQAVTAVALPKLLANDGSSADHFGDAVAVSGNTVVVGAPNNSSIGAAYVFERAGSVIGPAFALEPDSTGGVRDFGSSVAIDGDTLVVGAPDAENGTHAGVAIVFQRVGPSWFEEEVLEVPSLNDGAAFGFSVAIDGDTIVVGAPHQTLMGGNELGQTYVFVRSGLNGWSLQDTFSGDQLLPPDAFGYAVAIDGDRVVVGAPMHGTLGAESGKVFIFERNGTDWSAQGELTPGSSSSFLRQWFGASVALSDPYLLIGGPESQTGSNSPPRIWFYERNVTGWIPATNLTAPSSGDGSEFGYSVAIEGELAVVGTPGDDSSSNNTGAVYVFERLSGSWTDTAKLMSQGGSLDDKLGNSVALSKSVTVAGMPGDDDQGSNSGSAVVFLFQGELGAPCSGANECGSGFCADGVCCNEACGGSSDDCRVCSVTAGAVSDGSCSSLTGTTCDDENSCTHTDRCNLGVCSGDPVICSPSDACHLAGTCDATSGSCSNPVAEDGTTCPGGTCESGLCVMPDGGVVDTGTGGAAGASGAAGGGGEAGSAGSGGSGGTSGSGGAGGTSGTGGTGGSSGTGGTGGATTDAGPSIAADDGDTTGFYACNAGRPVGDFGRSWIIAGLAALIAMSRRRKRA